MRTREFVMKDMYSFVRTDEEHEDFYNICADAYMNIFSAVGIGDITFKTFASGGSFSKFSHEFQTISSAGEDTIYVSRDKSIAVNKEVYNDDVLKDIGLDKKELEEEQSIEVGNIFSLGTKFSDALGLKYKDEEGKEIPVVMGSYGIGPGRLMGTVAEALSDDKGLVWPKEIAPFSVHLVSVGSDEEVKKASDELYEKLVKAGIEVLYDDRDVRAGEKFADADLLGMPNRVVISSKTISEGKYELVDRKSGETKMVDEKELLSL
jgi:prolyl-tRNA synthetase